MRSTFKTFLKDLKCSLQKTQQKKILISTEREGEAGQRVGRSQEDEGACGASSRGRMAWKGGSGPGPAGGLCKDLGVGRS